MTYGIVNTLRKWPMLTAYLVTTTNEVCTEHVDVVFNPANVGVEKIAYHPGGER